MFQTRDAAFNVIKYAGRSRAIVLDNNDPLSKGRIIVDHPLLGETVWIPYLAVAGIFSVPEVGDVVYVECDAGFETHPVAWGNLNKGEDSLDDVPEEFQRITPTNRGFYSPGGHLIEIDDGSDPLGTDKGIRITTSDGSKIHLKEEPTAPGLDIETSSGQKVTIDGLADTISVETAGGANAKLDGISDAITAEVSFGDNIELSAANGFQVDTPAAGGTHLSMKAGKVDITSALDVSVTSSTGNITIKGSGDATVKLGTAKVGIGSPGGELVDLLEQLLTQLDTLITQMQAETHIGNLGYPTAPPTNAAAYAAVQAQIAIIKGFVTAIKGGI